MTCGIVDKGCFDNYPEARLSDLLTCDVILISSEQTLH